MHHDSKSIFAGLRTSMRLLLVLPLLCAAWGCENAFPPEEEPPSRIRSLKQPRWEVQPVAAGATGAVDEKGELAASPTPEATAAAQYKGAMQAVLEVFQRTEMRDPRARALDRAAADMTDGDAQEAYRAIQSGRRVDALIGIALLSRHYDKTGKWDRLEDAYRSLFKSVPELRLSPEHLTEHAVALAMLGKYKDSLERARVADELFRSLPVGDDTHRHLARLAEAQAWAYEGLSRETMKNGIPDAESRNLERQSLAAWERYLRTAKSVPQADDSLLEDIAKAEEHLANLRQAANIQPETGGSR